MSWLTELEELERLCAAAHDVAPHNRRLVGVEAPTLRRLVAATRAVAELGETRRTDAIARGVRSNATYQARCVSEKRVRAAEERVDELASSLTPVTRGGEESR